MRHMLPRGRYVAQNNARAAERRFSMDVKCKECGYWRKEECETYPRCHFEGPDDWAPCAQEDDYEEPEHDEFD